MKYYNKREHTYNQAMWSELLTVSKSDGHCVDDNHKMLVNMAAYINKRDLVGSYQQ